MGAVALDLGNTHHWVAVNSYRVRVAAFALIAIPIALHVLPHSPGALFWIAFVLQFAIYPHLMQWRARRSAEPEKAELDNLIVDAVMSGAWAAGLAFPLWISVALFLATLLNHTIMRGLPGVLICPAAILCGALASTTVIAFRVSTDTDGLVTLASITGLAIYLSLMGVEFFSYIRRLQEVQSAVAAQKQILEDANAALHEQIRTIHDLQEMLREQAHRDSLTGLFNRRYLDGTLEREIARCKRENTPMSMLLLDIDKFKGINDSYGHQAGDEVLRVLARLLQESARAEDIVCRYGGEEFLLVLPKMPLEIARQRGEDLLRQCGDTVVVFGDHRIRVTISIGVAVTPLHSNTAEGLIRRADEALYQAKQSGRNRVVTFGDAVG